MSVDQAIQDVLDEIRRLGGDAGVIVITKDGEIAMPYNSDGMKRASVSTTSAVYASTFE
jgi:isoaspartyl peptidase/L-asparaginase-like protein (Ntn-hydrolase superfamily)